MLGFNKLIALIASIQKFRDDRVCTISRGAAVGRSGSATADAYLNLFAVKRDPGLCKEENGFFDAAAGGTAINGLLYATRDVGQVPIRLNAFTGWRERPAAARTHRSQPYLVSGKLSPVPRHALLLFRVEALSHSEIALRLDISEDLVRSYIAQAMRDDRDEMWRNSRGGMREVGQGARRNRDLSNEAIDWVVRLGSGSATLTEQATFADWQTRSPAHAAASREIMLLLHMSGLPAPLCKDHGISKTNLTSTLTGVRELISRNLRKKSRL